MEEMYLTFPKCSFAGAELSPCEDRVSRGLSSPGLEHSSPLLSFRDSKRLFSFVLAAPSLISIQSLSVLDPLEGGGTLGAAVTSPQTGVWLTDSRHSRFGDWKPTAEALADSASGEPPLPGAPTGSSGCVLA